MTKPDSLKIVDGNKDYPNHKWFRTQQYPKRVRQMKRLGKYENFNEDTEYDMQKWELFVIKGDQVTMKPRWRRIYRLKKAEQWQEYLKITQRHGITVGKSIFIRSKKGNK